MALNFHVPQFIEVEDKVVGPFTLKQFIYLVGGVGLAFIAYKTLPLFLAVFIILPALVLACALAFYKVNNRPFIFLLEAAFKYSMGSKLYVWKKTDKKMVARVAPTRAATPLVPTLPKVGSSKLKELAWSLDVNEKVK